MHDCALLTGDNDLLLLDAGSSLARRPQARADGEDLDRLSAELGVKFRGAAENVESLVTICRVITSNPLAGGHVHADLTYSFPFCM